MARAPATKQNDNTDVPGVRIPPEDDLNRDLPRVDRIAQMYQKIARTATPSL